MKASFYLKKFGVLGILLLVQSACGSKITSSDSATKAPPTGCYRFQNPLGTACYLDGRYEVPCFSRSAKFRYTGTSYVNVAYPRVVLYVKPARYSRIVTSCF